MVNLIISIVIFSVSTTDGLRKLFLQKIFFNLRRVKGVPL